MCGRFQLSVKGKHILERFNVEVHDEVHRPEQIPGLNFKGFNCAPMQWLPVILNQQAVKLSYLRWGLIPPWAKDEKTAAKMINARSETILEKNTFKLAFRQRRCLIPANGFYEWSAGGSKQPYRFFMKDESLFAMAGIWEKWTKTDGSSISTFSILTTQNNALLDGIHNRMPVILKREEESVWLSSNDEVELLSLLKPYPAGEMQSYAISSLVNSVANDHESVIKPFEKPLELFN